MPNFSTERDLAFLLSDTARLLRTCADQEARRFGMTRAQWAVLFRLQRNEGLKQSELADLLEKMMARVLAGLDRPAREAAVASLTNIKNNLRQLIQQRVDSDLPEREPLERRYG